MEREMMDDTSPQSPPKPEGPVIDVEPVRETSADTAAPGGPEKRGTRLSPWLGLGALGVVAVAGVILLFAIPWRAPADVAGFRQDVSDRLSAIDGRVKALEGAGPNGDLTALERRIAALESTASGAAPVATRDDMEALRTRIAALEAGAQADADARAALNARIGAMAASDTQASANAALLALASSALDDAIRAGLSYRDELALVRRLRPDDAALTRLEPFADDGIEPLASLSRGFATYADAARVASVKAQAPQGFWAGLLKFVGGFVTVRDAGVTQNTPASETLNAMRLALAEGNLARAVTLKDQLPPASQSALAPWVSRADAHLGALDAARDLRRRVIVDLTKSALNASAPAPTAPARAPTTPQ